MLVIRRSKIVGLTDPENVIQVTFLSCRFLASERRARPLQSAPTSTADQAADQRRVLTWRDAHRLSPLEAVDRWLNREQSFMHERDPQAASWGTGAHDHGRRVADAGSRSACTWRSWRALPQTRWRRSGLSMRGERPDVHTTMILFGYAGASL